jgi:hypothetical protein
MRCSVGALARATRTAPSICPPTDTGNAAPSDSPSRGSENVSVTSRPCWASAIAGVDAAARDFGDATTILPFASVITIVASMSRANSSTTRSSLSRAASASSSTSAPARCANANASCCTSLASRRCSVFA